MGKAHTTEQFITDAKKVHGDRYNYNKVVYIRNSFKVVVICKIHGEFNIRLFRIKYTEMDNIPEIMTGILEECRANTR